MIDQRKLPEELTHLALRSWREVAESISDMAVRGAGEALGALESAAIGLKNTRPTAVNLTWAVDRVMMHARTAGAARGGELAEAVPHEAEAIADEDVRANVTLGEHGAALVPDGARILTHCNAGALATVEWGTALAVVFKAHAAGESIHVWVDETRPRRQGARLTSWELHRVGVPMTLISDTAAGRLFQTGRVDMVVVGSDRVAANGDVVNKIGT